MMKIAYLFLVFVGVSNAQISGEVLDAYTKEPLVYANVISQTQQTGVATNYEGAFQINKKNDIKFDTLLVSYLGYVPQKIVVNYKKKDTVYKIYLKEDLNLLDEVVIQSTKKLSKTITKIKSKRKKTVNRNLRYNEELVKLIHNNKKIEGKLLNATFYFRDYRGGSYGPNLPVHYRLRFYSIDTISKKPKDLLVLRRDIIIKPENKKQEIKVDLTPHNIKFPKEGLFVGFQSLNPSLTQPKPGRFYKIAPMPAEIHVKKTSSFYRLLGRGWDSYEILGGFKRNHYRDLYLDVELKYYED